MTLPTSGPVPIVPRLEAVTGQIDTLRQLLNGVIREMDEDTSMWVIVDIVNALWSLRNAAVVLDKVTDAIEADAATGQSSTNSSVAVTR